ncbi:sensor histidine kinase [Paenibacillus nasutitermitis]|uniref:HAMP domain-containing protein n=1 Tax=Paenibacillus nasutitermitis TaxID=1652958 RepID=A0A917E0H8_9BACL|nr:histidine kinase [Paenibacillus nasutitermitis]GGD85388.1 hypothetical protein GCM10010911_49780 [Paenibacillus nasutitermitis]
MKPFSLFRRMTIYPKLIIAFLIAIVPIVVVSLQMNQMGADTIREKLLASMNSHVLSGMKELEAEFDRIIRLHQQFVLDGDVSNLSTLSTIWSQYDVYVMQNRVQKKLWLTKNFNPYVKIARAHIPLIGKTLLPESEENVMPDADIAAFQDAQTKQTSPVVYWNNKLLINTLYPSPPSPGKPPLYIIQSEIDPSRLTGFLRQIEQNMSGTSALLVNGKQTWKASGRLEQPDDQLLAMIRQFVEQRKDNDLSGQGTLLFNHTKYNVTFAHSTLLNMELVIYSTERMVLGPLNEYQSWLRFLFGVSLVVVFGFSYWIFRQIHTPLGKMVRAFRKVEKGDLTIAIGHPNDDEFKFLYGQFNSMVRQLQHSVQEVYESRITTQQAELKQLQSQINPHFLYNTYFMVHRMAEAHDLDNVVKATKYLGEYFQYITRNAGKEATLAEEWNHTLAYLELQQMRFHNRIEARIIEEPSPSMDIRLPRLILQPLVENVFQHGLRSVKAGGIIGMAQLALPDGGILIRVEDNGQDLSREDLDNLIRRLRHKPAPEAERTGLMNVHRRLQLMRGGNEGLRLSRSPLGGLRIEIEWPGSTGQSGEER